MKVVSVNVGTPRAVPVRAGTVLTSIFKAPVEGRVAIRKTNIEGDRQADLTVHGGTYKAVYCYPGEHYEFWKGELPGEELPLGMFGENLTTTGLLENEVQIGDRLRVGTALLQISQPRMPCFKLGLRFNRPDMVKRFWQSERSGVYFSVVEEGEVSSGDEMKVESKQKDGITVAEVVGLYKGTITGDRVMKRLSRAPLYGSWKRDIHERHSRML